MTIARRDLKVLLLSTWLPKPCGIATYSHDLAGALLAANPQDHYRVVAINDPGDAFAYPPVVRHELAREDLAGLRGHSCLYQCVGGRCHSPAT